MMNFSDSVEPLADAIRFNGSFATMTYAHPFADVSIELGIDIEAVQGATKQLQFAVNSTNATLPGTFAAATRRRQRRLRFGWGSGSDS